MPARIDSRGCQAALYIESKRQHVARGGVPFAYYLILILPNLSVHLEIFLSMWVGGQSLLP